MFLLLCVLVVIMVGFLYYFFRKYTKKEADENGVIKRVYVNNGKNVLLIMGIMFAAVLIMYSSLIFQASTMQSTLIEKLDAQQTVFLNASNLDSLSNSDWLSEVKEYNRNVDVYYTYVAAYYNESSYLFWNLCGPFNPIVFKDAKREYKKFEITNLQFNIEARDILELSEN